MYQRVLTYQQPMPQNNPMPTLQTLKIIPKASAFFADDFIEGQVELSSSVQIIINDINLVLNSMEFWSTFSKEMNTNINEKNDTSLVSVNLDVKRKLNINSNLVALKPGKFNFGFKFKVPKIPEASFEFPSQEGKAYLRYYLAANIISPYVKGNTSTYIIIKKRQSIEMNKQVSFTVENSIHKWGLFGGGKTKMVVTSINGTDNFKFGEKINFDISIDNKNGKINTTECKAVLNRTVVFKTKLSEKKKTVVDELISKKIKTETLPGESKNFSCNLSLEKIENKNFDIKGASIPYTNISDINYFLPTMKTLILECSYTLKFTLYFDSFVKYNDRPRIIIDLIICHQSFDEYKAEMDRKIQMSNNMMPPNMMPPPNMGMPPHMPPPPNMMNNGIPNTPLSKRNMNMNMNLNNGPSVNPTFGQMNNNMNDNQDIDLPSMEEVEDNGNNNQDNFNNDYNNNNFNNNNYGNNTFGNDNNNYDNNYNNFNNGQNMNNMGENNYNDNNNELPPPPQNNEYPEYPSKPESNN